MCTTVIVGNKASSDGSLLLARSADSSAFKAQIFVIHPAAEYGPEDIYRTRDHNGVNNFSYPMPEKAMRYTSVPYWRTQLHGAVGFNEAGLGITATESIFARDDFLEIDPYNKDTGITEDDIIDVLLPRCKTAKECILFLGRIIETIGAGEGFGVGVADANEAWYLETGTGHQWVAARIPQDQYYASGNQGRLRFYKENDPEWLGSPTVISFAVRHGFYDPEKDGEFDFSKAYTRNDSRDRIYNDPRVWVIQKMLSPQVEQETQDGRNFPVFAHSEKPVTLQNLKDALRNHFQGTEQDSYAGLKAVEELWRPVSVFRTYESHIIQIRPWMPLAVGNVIYLAFGMSDLSCYIPIYHGIKTVPESYGFGSDVADDRSVYWRFRKLQTLAMSNYQLLAPVVQARFKEFEEKVAVRQKNMEDQYLLLLEKDPKAADQLLQDFSANLFREVDVLLEELTNKCFTLQTEAIQTKIYFGNKKNKD
jgi:dipeptidase